MQRWFAALVLILGLACFSVPGCSDKPSNQGGADMAQNPIFAARPYTLYSLGVVDKTKPAPLLVLLHGYGVTGDVQDFFFNLKPVADKHGFLYAYATGTREQGGQMNTFWNATDACCNFEGSSVDDSAYLTALIDDVASRYSVDSKRVFFVGHSNGGFMSHRMACDHADKIAAIVSLAGAEWLDASKCNPSEPVSVLQVHGDKDAVIGYDGGQTTGGGTYPSAVATVTTWATKNGCTGALTPTAQTRDLDTQIPGAETTNQQFFGCPPTGDVALWTIAGGGHVPIFQTDPDKQPTSWGEEIWAWLSAHPKQ